MAGITGLGTTYNLPNYTGILHQLSPTSTPFYSAIGGLSGGGQTTSTEFEWETVDLRNPGQNTALEGAAAPTAQSRVRANVTNVVEIHQEKVAVSYTKLAAYGQKAGTNNDASNPIINETDFQVRTMLTQMVRDVNWGFWNGKYVKPSDNTTARQTRGLLQAITTNRQSATGSLAYSAATSATDTITVTHALTAGDKVIFDSVGAAAIVPGRVYFVQSVSTTVSFKIAATSGGSALTVGTASGISLRKATGTALAKSVVNGLAQLVYDNGGINDQVTGVFAVNSAQKVAISGAFGSQFQENSREVGGVNISTVITDFGELGIMMDRAIPQDTIALVSLAECSPVYLEVPGKGHFFAEPLAKTGAADEVMLYGEVGLTYGAETAHGVINGLAV